MNKGSKSGEIIRRPEAKYKFKSNSHTFVLEINLFMSGVHHGHDVVKYIDLELTYSADSVESCHDDDDV